MLARCEGLKWQIQEDYVRLDSMFCTGTVAYGQALYGEIKALNRTLIGRFLKHEEFYSYGHRIVTQNC